MIMRKLTVRDKRAKLEHDEWLKKNNVHPDQIKLRKPVKVLSAGDRVSVAGTHSRQSPPFQSGFAPIPGKRSVFDSRWKKVDYEDEDMARRERVALIQAERLKNRIMPLYNKGPLQLASENEDMTKVGALSRR